MPLPWPDTQAPQCKTSKQYFSITTPRYNCTNCGGAFVVGEPAPLSPLRQLALLPLHLLCCRFFSSRKLPTSAVAQGELCSNEMPLLHHGCEMSLRLCDECFVAQELVNQLRQINGLLVMYHNEVRAQAMPKDSISEGARDASARAKDGAKEQNGEPKLAALQRAEEERRASLPYLQHCRRWCRSAARDAQALYNAGAIPDAAGFAELVLVRHEAFRSVFMCSPDATPPSPLAVSSEHREACPPASVYAHLFMLKLTVLCSSVNLAFGLKCASVRLSCKARCRNAGTSSL